MLKIMDAIVDIVSILGYYAIILSCFGGPGDAIRTARGDWYARFWNLEFFKRDCGHDYWPLS